MLISAELAMHSWPTRKRISYLLYNPVRALLLRWKIDPASLRFWHKKGTQIRVWRKRHGLKDSVAGKKNMDQSIPVQESAAIRN